MIHGIESREIEVNRYLPIKSIIHNRCLLREYLVIPYYIDLANQLCIALGLRIHLKIVLNNRVVPITRMCHCQQPKSI